MNFSQVIGLLISKNIQIELHWVPAHSGVDGNEKADKAAQESTGWKLKKHRNNRCVEEDTNRTAPKVFLPPLKAAIKAVYRQQIDTKWAESWAAESKGKEPRALAPTPSTKVLQPHKRIKKPKIALITQMRTGKIGLRAFLYGRKLVNNSQCECGHRSQTVRHILSECRKLTRLRRETWRDEKRKEPFGVVEWRKMLTHPSYAKKAAYFMLKTGLLKLFQGIAVAQP